MSGCDIRRSHVAHRTFTGAVCGGIPYKDQRYRFAEDLARWHVGLPPRDTEQVQVK